VSDLAFLTALKPSTELGAWPLAESPAVYVLVPPLLTLPTRLSEFVIVARNPRTNHVDIFPCDENGRIEEWEPLAEFAGADHMQALRACGYEVVVLDVA